MENDNIKRDENLQEEAAAEAVAAETTAEENAAEEAVEAVAETENEVSETAAETDLIGDEWKTEDTESEEAEAAEADVIVEEIQLTEEEIAEIERLKKKECKRNMIIAAAIAAVIAIVAFFVCYTEGVGSKTIVNETGLSAMEQEEGFWAKLKTDNIRYENPIVTLFDKVTGRNKDSVMKINGIAVDKDVFGFVTNSSGLNCVYSLVQTGMIQDISKFDWNKVDEQIGMSYLELSKSMAVESLLPMYAVIAEGKKNGVEFTDEDDKQIKDWIAEQKTKYGAEFETVLKDSGYADEDTLYEIQKIQLYMQKIYEDIVANPSMYITNSIKKKVDDGKITVKHILVGFEQGEDGSVSDEAKAKAKKTAEEVLAKVKAGEDFDSLVEKYNTDPGATDEGYTFAQDGSMVKEFEDASFALEIGGISELVETTYGYHIIKRIERNITADDYIMVMQKIAPVNIKKGAYSKVNVNVDLNQYFGAPTAEDADPENAAE